MQENKNIVQFPQEIAEQKEYREYTRNEAADAEKYMPDVSDEEIDEIEEECNNRIDVQAQRQEELDRAADADAFFTEVITPLYKLDINEHKLERFFSLASFDYGMLSQLKMLDTQRVRAGMPIVEDKGILLTDIGVAFVFALNDDEFDTLVDGLLQRSPLGKYVVEHLADVFTAPLTSRSSHAKLLYNNAMAAIK